MKSLFSNKMHIVSCVGLLALSVVWAVLYFTKKEGAVGDNSNGGRRALVVRSEQNNVASQVAKKSAIKTAIPPWPEEELPNSTGWVIDDSPENADDIPARIKAVLDEIMTASLNGKKRECLRAVDKLQAQIRSGVEVPRWVKLKALGALRDFGTDSMPELVGFVVDGDSEVVEVAKEDFSMQLLEADGDAELSSIIKTVASTVTDQEVLSSCMTHFMDMRDSVRAETAIAIIDSGNEAAISVLQENFDTYFADGENTVPQTREGLEEFAQQHPSTSDDEFMYGAMGNWDKK